MSPPNLAPTSSWGQVPWDTWQPRTWTLAAPVEVANPGMVGHKVALGLALAKQATPAFVDLVLALGLSQYPTVPITRGTDNEPSSKMKKL
jgi:hypothetical protein